MVKVDWDAGHSPLFATANAALTTATVAQAGSMTGLPASWVVAGTAAGAAGSVVAGSIGSADVAKGSLIMRASAWLAAGGWVSFAMHDPFSEASLASLGILSCLFGAASGAMSAKARRKALKDALEEQARFRVGIKGEWEDRLERVCNAPGCIVVGVQKWEHNSGYTLEIKLPGGGVTWRQLAMRTDELAADADLPTGCGVEFAQGVSRGYALANVSTVNALADIVDLPEDSSPLDFEKDFDIGIHRDRSLALVNMRQNSGMLAGDKRSGKTNELHNFISRFVRMPNLLVWVIDFNGGGVALPWLQAWDELGRPGRPPIDWVAADDREAKAMATAAVRIAIKRKTAYQRLMRKANTDLLPMTPEVPGIMLITDEGAEILGDPKRRLISDPYKEVLRIAGAVGVNQLNCFLRATADITGDPLIKTQSRLRVGMRMGVEDEIAYLLGWKSGVKPEDMPDRGYGAYSQDPAQPARIFKGYRVLPDNIDRMVKHTSHLRPELDEISTEVAGDVYANRWERAGFIFEGTDAPQVSFAKTADGGEATDDAPGSLSDQSWARPALSPEETKENLRKAREEAEAEREPSITDEFERVMNEAGVADPNDPSTWPDAERPPTDEEEDDSTDDDLRAIVYGIVKAMTGNGGISVGDIRSALVSQYGEDATPRRETITRWLREDGRIWKPSGYRFYELKPEED